jgi:hypothetical protein
MIFPDVDRLLGPIVGRKKSRVDDAGLHAIGTSTYRGQSWEWEEIDGGTGRHQVSSQLISPRIVIDPCECGLAQQGNPHGACCGEEGTSLER